MKMVRKWNCSVCGKPLIFDDVEKTLSCGCGVYRCAFVNTSEFIPMPKYDVKYWKSERFAIDCAKFLDVDHQILHISDKNSIFRGNENPMMQLRWIHYPKDDKTQLCLAISGDYHIEKIGYNIKELNKWNERQWILIDPQTVKKILDFLERDPQLLASWI